MRSPRKTDNGKLHLLAGSFAKRCSVVSCLFLLGCIGLSIRESRNVIRAYLVMRRTVLVRRVMGRCLLEVA